MRARSVHGTSPWRALVLVAIALTVLAGCVSQEAVKKRQRESEGHYKDGISYIDTDQQRAFVSFQKSVQANPDNFDAHYALGNIYFQREEYGAAEREFRICLDLDPRSGEALNYLGRTLIFSSRLPEAIEVLKKATGLVLYATPDKPYLNLAYAYTLQGDVPAAIRAYQESLKIEPPSIPRPLVYLELGRLYMKQGDDGRAREAFAQAKALDPGGPVAAEAAKLTERLR